MPPPACQKSLPSRTHMLRMVLPVSRLTLPRSSPSQPMQPAYGPRARPSSSRMISMARTLGAPETVPAGKAAASTSRASRPSARRAVTRLVRCMTWE